MVTSRPVNSRLFEHAKNEFDRLTGYMYRHSTSPRAPTLIIALKAIQLFRSTNHLSIAKIVYTRSNYHYLKSAENFSAYSETTFDLHRMNKRYRLPKPLR